MICGVRSEKIAPPDSVDALLLSLRRSLLAANKAPRTIESYTEAVRLLGAFLTESGMPTLVRDTGPSTP